jgi:uncharacterized protein
MSGASEARLALFPLLASKSKSGYLGRTALMKYMYLLQAVRGVPLGYHFTLYSYGPFDSDVLSDLSIAEAVEGVKTELELYSGGYGYRIRPGRNAKWLERRAEKFLAQYSTDTDWVVKKFGSFRSDELELVGTIVYVDQESARRKKTVSLDQVAKLVHEVKPHFTEAKVLQYARQLASERVLRASIKGL